MTDWSHLPIEPHHAQLLERSAITPDIAQRQGIHSITTIEQLPETHTWAAERAVPSLAFPWSTPGGDTLTQIRLDVPFTVTGEKRPAKYLWPQGSSSPIGVVRTGGEGPVLFIEGTKQALAAASVLPAGGPIYAIAGCRAWSTDGCPVTDLEVADGRDVLVIFDADAATNPDVYDAAEKFRAALLFEGATSVRYVRLPAGGTTGLDDLLGGREPGRRAAGLQRLIDAATTKPADRRPTRKTKDTEPALLGDQDRPAIDVNDDRLNVITNITGCLRNRFDGTELFHFGQVLSRRVGERMEPIGKGVLVDLVQQAATTVTVGDKGDMRYAEPTGTVLDAVLANRRSEFTQLDRIATVPFVRPDGTICQTAGYDAATCTYLTRTLAVQVPDEPTTEDVRSAVKLLTEDWLVDFMDSMPSQADRANTLALFLTPLIRTLVGVAPLAVVNGLQPGVGKNLLGDALAIFTTGATVIPLPFNTQDEELRKVILATFRQGRELFVFDEAHEIESATLARALTATTYTDRILGVSNTAEFPNHVTWVSLGNNVQVNNDMSRRVYMIRLAPAGADPQDRSADSFRHPDIKAWTAAHRDELVTAALTLIRAWFTAGQPLSPDGRRFGSFEAWGGVVGGVLEVAGVPGFLHNLKEFRSETDFAARYWTEHLEWLEQRFGAGTEFRCAEVLKAAKLDPDALMPPGLENLDSLASRELGKAYAKVENRTYGTLSIIQTKARDSRAARWAVTATGSTSKQTEIASNVGNGGHHGASLNPSRVEKNTLVGGAHVNVSMAAGAVEPCTLMPTDAPPWSPGPDPAAPPASHLRAAVTIEPMPIWDTCPDCDAELALVGPTNFWRACPSCHPSTFDRH